MLLQLGWWNELFAKTAKVAIDARSRLLCGYSYGSVYSNGDIVSVSCGGA